MKAKVIAYYLPQYYPFKENDEWWGKGFTEWTNVAKAKPLFPGHYQPKIPSELGFYDLRVLETAEAQAQLAKEAGIYGFCYWHYWFGNGKELLDMPFKRAVETGKPNFPFCLGWANESWYAKLWNKSGSTGKILIEQVYPGEEDNRLHYDTYKNAFLDKRYIRVDNKPFFLIYNLTKMSSIIEFMQQWNKWAKEDGIADEFYFVARAKNIEEYEEALKIKEFKAITIAPIERWSFKTHRFSFIRILCKALRIIGIPYIRDYREATQDLWEDDIEGKENVLPNLVPNWDHSPRSGKRAKIFIHCTPKNWEGHVKNILEKIKNKKNRIVMLKSWNEWGEGNYMEPDIKYGKQYIEILGQQLNEE